jgi:glutathione peroxidase
MKTTLFAILAIALGGSMLETANAATSAKSFYDFEVTPINGADAGKPKKLSSYQGKVLLVVNTASECGFTPQYKGLQALQDKYSKEGFTILGFPSNDYGAQEPGSNAEIKTFCEKKFNVTFPLFEKAPVSGNRAQPLYQYLTENAPEKGAVGWNFEKFLISREGKIIGRYKSKVAPDNADLTKAIETALKTK